MRTRARSWGRPLGFAAIIAVGLLVLGAVTGNADDKRDRDGKRYDRRHSEIYDENERLPRDYAGGGHVWPVLSLGGERFFWNRSAQMFVPRGLVNVRIGYWAPLGATFVDPFSGEKLRNLGRLRRLQDGRHHPPVLDVRYSRSGHFHGWRRLDRDDRWSAWDD